MLSSLDPYIEDIVAEIEDYERESRNAYMRLWYVTGGSEAAKECARRYHATHREEIVESRRQERRSESGERIRERDRKYWAANVERKREQQRASYARHRAERNAAKRQLYIENHEEILEKARRDADRVNARRRERRANDPLRLEKDRAEYAKYRDAINARKRAKRAADKAVSA